MKDFDVIKSSCDKIKVVSLEKGKIKIFVTESYITSSIELDEKDILKLKGFLNEM